MLTLPIKKKWFNMVKSGEKKEEYRDITPYYTSRFTNLFSSFETDIKPIQFRNGYNSNSPSFIANCSLVIKEGKDEWGAEKGKEYYVLKVHGIKHSEEGVVE